MPGRDPGGTRYSPLTQITPANVSQLKVAWVYHMKPAGSDASLHPSEDQPLVVGSTMYVVTPYSRVVALDPPRAANSGCFKFPMAIRPRFAEPTTGPAGRVLGRPSSSAPADGRMYSISAATGQLECGVSATTAWST